MAASHILADQMGVKLPPIRQSPTSYYVTTNRLYHLFEPWSYDWGRKSAGKRVPHSVLEAPIESQRAFIQALFDAEGHVGETHCELTMASEQIVYALKTLLRNFGVWARVRQVMKWATNGARIKRPYYRLTFGGTACNVSPSNSSFASYINKKRWSDLRRCPITRTSKACQRKPSSPPCTNEVFRFGQSACVRFTNGRG